MMVYKFYISIFLMLAGNLMLGQTFTNSDATKGLDNLQNRAVQLGLLSTQAPTPSRTNASVRNAIFIQQIGDNNSVNANTRSVESDVNLFQRGVNNDISLDVTAGIIDENVIQNGVSNRFIDLTSMSGFLHRANVIQNGRNQNLIWSGNNSISDRMIVSMRGNNQTVFIRNIKR